MELDQRREWSPWLTISPPAGSNRRPRIRRLLDARPTLLDFHFGVRGEGSDYEVHLVVEPDAANVGGLLDAEFRDLDDLVNDVVTRHTDVAKIVVVWKSGEMSLGYALRSDAFPIEITEAAIPETERD